MMLQAMSHMEAWSAGWKHQTCSGEPCRDFIDASVIASVAGRT